MSPRWEPEAALLAPHLAAHPVFLGCRPCPDCGTRTGLELRRVNERWVVECTCDSPLVSPPFAITGRGATPGLAMDDWNDQVQSLGQDEYPYEFDDETGDF